MVNAKPAYEDSEAQVDVVELGRILVRRKWWVLAVLFVVIAAATVYVFYQPPVYEASVRIRIGQVANAGLLESQEMLSSRLLALHGEVIAQGIKRKRPFLDRVEPAGPILLLVVEGGTPIEAATLLQEIFTDIQKSHGRTYEQNLELFKEHLESIDTQRGALSRQYEQTFALVDELKKKNPVQASLLALELGRIAEAIATLNSERPGLAQKVVPPMTQRTELLGEIIAPAEPSAPRRGLVLALACVLGLMGGVTLAFIVEYIDTSSV